MWPLVACGSARETGSAPQPDQTIPVDSAAEFGFSANDVVALVGSRQYVPAADVGDDHPGPLVAHAPVTVHVTEVMDAYDHLSDLGVAEAGHELWALVRFTLHSGDGQIDVAGHAILAATGLDDADVAWTSRDVTDSATGMLPEWTETETQAKLDEGVCGQAEVTWQLGHRALYLSGAVEAPSEIAQVYWTEPDACGAVATLDRVVLKAPTVR